MFLYSYQPTTNNYLRPPPPISTQTIPKTKQKPYSVNLLIAGFDVKTNKPSLYWLDHLASLADVPFAAHGYGAYYCLSLLDRYHREDITEEEGIKLLQKCVGELRSRMILNMPDFVAKVVNKDGIRIVQL